MILTYITMGLVIVGIVLSVVNDKCNTLLLVLGVTSLILGILMGAVIGLVAIANHTAVDNQIYKKQMEYESITRQLQIIDSEYEDVSKAEIIQKVYDWNTAVYQSKYWAKSPWTNWLYNKKYSDSLEYIEMEKE
ncbi:hypothetical protein DXB97_03725 [Firmicutes bacterium OM07-11]|nr:hypothetical protein DXB97_03725 [Firmicutes bacterium OM07-11]